MPAGQRQAAGQAFAPPRPGATGSGKQLRPGYPQCEDCAEPRRAVRGMPAEGKKRWCTPCAKAYPGTIDLNHPKCEVCHVKNANCGLPGELKSRWCAACARSYAGPGTAVNLYAAKFPCEDCDGIGSRWGLPAEGRRRWCGGCARTRDEGAIDLESKRSAAQCEDCQQKRALWGLVADGRKPRWCRTCSKAHTDAVSCKDQKQCEDCGEATARFGLNEKGNKVRWCAACAQASHPGAKHASQPSKAARARYKESAHCCEDCRTPLRSEIAQYAQPGASLPARRGGGRRGRWCSACSAAHPGAQRVHTSICPGPPARPPARGG
jgi:hypothetical protein